MREQRLFDALKAGNTRKASAQYTGVDERWAAGNVAFAGVGLNSPISLTTAMITMTATTKPTSVARPNLGA